MPGEALFDQDHLDRQTGGDTALAQELLDLFREQCGQILTGFADTSATPETRADLAHRLKGSALGIGAFRLASCADAAEDRLRAKQDARAAIAEIASTVRATLDVIAPHR